MRLLVIRLAALALLLSLGASFAQSRGGGSNDPLVLGENWRNDPTPLNNSGNYSVSGHTCRTDAGGIPCNATINPAQKTLVLITLGASNGASVGPSSFTPTNASAIDNFNIYDGALYQNLDPLLGQTRSSLGPGSIGPRLADLLITNGAFNRVILVPGAVGGATSTQYAPGGVLYGRGCVAMKRLASRGITPATTGVTFSVIFFLGENDTGTSSASYQAAVQQQVVAMQACGFSGRVFIPTETILNNAANATIQGAQASLVALGAPWFGGGNLDSLTGGTNRQPDGTHLTAAGQGSGATLVYNAMHATGAPF